MFNGDTINTITLELKWLEKIIAQRVQLFQDNSDQFEVVPFDDLSHRDDLYSKIINHYGKTFESQFIVAIYCIPSISWAF